MSTTSAPQLRNPQRGFLFVSHFSNIFKMTALKLKACILPSFFHILHKLEIQAIIKFQVQTAHTCLSL